MGDVSYFADAWRERSYTEPAARHPLPRQGDQPRDQLLIGALSESPSHPDADSIAPFWDGNETWLVLGGAGMMVASRWPIRSFCRPSLCRSSSCCWRQYLAASHFEFRWIGVTSKRYWTFAFAAGSVLAALCQGLVLGSLIQGVKVENG
jgi:hypothetical protein